MLLHKILIRPKCKKKKREKKEGEKKAFTAQSKKEEIAKEKIL